MGGAVSINGPTILDTTSSPIIGHINVNQKFYIASEITNLAAESQSFVYIVKIVDGEGTTVVLEWFGGETDSGQTLNIAVSWTLSTPDTYTAQVFLWDGIHTQNALDVSKSIIIPVN